TVAPRATVPLARSVLRLLVGHLVVDATDSRLGPAIARLRADGAALNLNLLGEAVLGRREADRRLARTRELLARPDVDSVSIKVSAAVPPHSPWAFDEAVEEISDRLEPLFQDAAAAGGKFINLDMEEYHDLDLTLAVFKRLLDRPELLELEAGIVLQAYLPDALGAMIGLQDWAAARRARGGAPIKVRLVKGANLPMEMVDAELHGWPLATWSSKQESDTNYKRLLDYALHPERTANIRIGVAGHNLFDVAFAWLLAQQRQTVDAVEFEMLLGMASDQARAVSATVGALRLYTPVVHPAEFDVAIAYLIRRLEEVSSEQNYLSAAFELADRAELFEREADRFRVALEALDPEVPAPRRDQDRGRAPAAHDDPGMPFANAPDSDPSTAANRDWARAILRRVPSSPLGVQLTRAATITDAAELEAVLAQTAAAAPTWGRRPAAERAAILSAAADQLEVRRGDLIEVMAAECGKTFDQADPEVSEAVDFAAYYAEHALELDQLDGAEHVPVPLALVAPPWNFPVSIPAGSVLGPLAAGSAVIIKPAPQAQRCASVMVQTLWEAGVPQEVLRLINVDEGELGRALISDPRVGRLILTGAYETATLFRSWRPQLPLLAETSGKNAMVITPSADPDLAVRDLVASAFGHAGQKCSAASLAILVDSVASSPRFRRQLVDAVTSLTVALPTDPRAQVGPLIEPAAGKLERALTTLEPGDSWLVEPRRCDASGRLWTPGVKDGVRRGSQTHMVEFFGPVLGLIAARDLDEAIAIQNEVQFGLTAGLHSLDGEEIATWLERVQAGNLYVNRGITGAIVRRQPFGGWKRSAVGPGAKAGGPNYLLALSDWRSRPSSAVAPLGPLAERAMEAARQAGLDTSSLERALRSDAAALAAEFGVERDVSGLRFEHNRLRYRPAQVEIRSADGEPGALLRVAAAGVLAGAELSVSTSVALPGALSQLLAAWRVPVLVEPQESWLQGLAQRPAGRIRLIGATEQVAVERADLTVYAQPVTESGRLEMLPFLHEQSVSICAHRFGSTISAPAIPAPPGVR
ncbi:MAG TPA: bifunctional proline dehydrogenase/L-glutamate gamma-semialdehyde dehydrogenase, partial [Solirubrobacteraceae bacterium]|nr:bifunctional proline dehydrogenase/L-glutamate gamma-semialdehyde dehydrogenase [Solirubrobacteraceae bacterium]